MALITCKECKSQISDSAAACPQCGAKPPKPTSRFTILIGGLFAIGVAMSVFKTDETSKAPQKSVAQARADAILEAARREARDDAISKARSIKDSMKNPASFELVKLTKHTDGTVCVLYRGTNSFNAVVTELKAITKAGKVLDKAGACSSAVEQDFTYLKRSI